MKDLQQWAAVQQLLKHGKKISSIARELHMSRNTVRKLARLKDAPSYHREVYHTKVDDFKEQILQWRCEPYKFNGTRIYRELLLIGYKGSASPVYRYLKKLDEDLGHISSKATVRIETPVGDQAQFDWSEYSVPVHSIIRKVYCFSLILAACRKKAVCFSLKSDAGAIYEAIQELYDDLGGVTLELLIDNPKALVIENNPKTESEVKYNPQALLLAKHLGTELNACPCFWPRKKGKIEKPFQYIEEQFIKGNTFESMEDLNRRGKRFIEDWNNETHSTTKRIPNEFYELEERGALLPLPEKHYYVNKPLKRHVSNDCVISFNANKYSVPCRYADKDVLCRLYYGFRLVVTDKKGNRLCSWELAPGKGNILMDNNHTSEIATKISTSIPQIRRDFTSIFKHGKAYLDAAERCPRIQQPTHHARKIMLLLDIYEVHVLDQFIAYAIETDNLEIHLFKKLLKESTRAVKAPMISIKAKDREPADDIADNGNIVRNCSYYDDYLKVVNKENE